MIAVYVTAYSIATAFHLADILRWGVLAYTFAPFALNLFWTSLVIIDPLVVLLLLGGRRRTGIVLALATICADVAANSYAFLAMGHPEFAISLQLQSAFLGFVVGSAAFLWPSRDQERADRASATQ